MWQMLTPISTFTKLNSITEYNSKGLLFLNILSSFYMKKCFSESMNRHTNKYT